MKETKISYSLTDGESMSVTISIGKGMLSLGRARKYLATRRQIPFLWNSSVLYKYVDGSNSKNSKNLLA